MVGLRLISLLLMAGLAARGAETVFVTVVPDLLYSPGCHAEVDVHNLSSSEATVAVQGHSAGGGLVALAGRDTWSVRLGAGEKRTVRLALEDGRAWLAVRETLRGTEPSVAVVGRTECIEGNKLHSATREATFPTTNPFFKAAPRHIWTEGQTLLVINASSRQASISACYSAGHLVSNGDGKLEPLCSPTVDATVAPFGTRYLPLERDEAALVSLKTTGEAIVMQMLLPVSQGTKLFRVDSKIEFGREAR